MTRKLRKYLGENSSDSFELANSSFHLKLDRDLYSSNLSLTPLHLNPKTEIYHETGHYTVHFNFNINTHINAMHGN
jgi:hypothetical protein